MSAQHKMNELILAAIERGAVIDEQLTQELRRHNRELLRQRSETPEARAHHEALKRPPRKMRFDATTVPALVVPFCESDGGREIPSEYWVQVGMWQVEIACPCGEAPKVSFVMPGMCQCGRAYLYTGKAVFVAFSPVQQVEAPVIDDAEVGTPPDPETPAAS